MTDPTPIEALAALVNDPAYRTIAEGMAALRQPLFDQVNLFAHVDALAQIMPRLENALEAAMPPAEEPEIPEEPGEPEEPAEG